MTQSGRQKGFETTTEYFEFLIEQDREQLLQPLNIITGLLWCKGQLSIFNSSIRKRGLQARPSKTYLRRPRSHKSNSEKDDLTVVGVVDLEWSYIGPEQLFVSAPWWLLQDRLNNYDTSHNSEDVPKIIGRFLRHLEIFQHVLQQEGESGDAKKELAGENELSDLVKLSGLWTRGPCGFIWFSRGISTIPRFCLLRN